MFLAIFVFFWGGEYLGIAWHNCCRGKKVKRGCLGVCFPSLWSTCVSLFPPFECFAAFRRGSTRKGVERRLYVRNALRARAVALLNPSDVNPSRSAASFQGATGYHPCRFFKAFYLAFAELQFRCTTKVNVKWV